MWRLAVFMCCLSCLFEKSTTTPVMDWSFNGNEEPPQQANGFELIAMTDQLKGEFVESHNRARSAVSPTAANMVAVEWDDEIQEVAERNARICAFRHSDRNNRKIRKFQYALGENLFVGMSGAPSHKQPSAITKFWADEYKYYNFNSNSCKSGKMCGHYTQIVWADTKKIGCAIGKCRSIAGLPRGFDIIAFCNYGPAGNWWGTRPYRIGASCSDCPTDHSRQCKNDLCY